MITFEWLDNKEVVWFIVILDGDDWDNDDDHHHHDDPNSPRRPCLAFLGRPDRI